MINITLLSVLTIKYPLTRIQALLPPPVQCSDVHDIYKRQCNVGILTSYHTTSGAIAYVVVLLRPFSIVSERKSVIYVCTIIVNTP